MIVATGRPVPPCPAAPQTVSKRFGDLEVLRDINLSLRHGEVLVIIGPSGGGKSTLCRTINRLEPIGSGTILFDGKPIPVEGHLRYRHPEGRDARGITAVDNALRSMCRDGSWKAALARDLPQVPADTPPVIGKFDIPVNLALGQAASWLE